MQCGIDLLAGLAQLSLNLNILYLNEYYNYSITYCNPFSFTEERHTPRCESRDEPWMACRVCQPQPTTSGFKRRHMRDVSHSPLLHKNETTRLRCPSTQTRGSTHVS